MIFNAKMQKEYEETLTFFASLQLCVSKTTLSSSCFLAGFFDEEVGGADLLAIVEDDGPFDDV